jgi:4-hydroxythreonine-4-phosphate dehydrogenase
VVGSGSAVSRKQVEALGAASDTIVMRIPHEVLLSRKGLPQWQSYGLELEQVMNAGRDLAVMPDPDATLDAAQGPLLSMALAAMVAPLADMAGSLVVTGGETARAVFDAWRIDRLLLMGEVEAGLPFSVAAGWRRELPVLTKAGGFGEPETLLSCLKFLRELDPGDAAEPGTNKGSR